MDWSSTAAASLHATVLQRQVSPMARAEALHVRLSADELAGLRAAAAAARGWTMAQWLQDMIRQRPDQKPS
jgi:hypothetical protein